MINIFKLFKKSSDKKPVERLHTDFSWLQVDMHNHLLFGLDDGAQTMEDTVRFLKHFVTLGYTDIICTPHSNEDPYPNESAVILDKLASVQQLAKEHQIPINIRAAAEYMMDLRFLKKLEVKEPLLCLKENKVLVEMSYKFESPYLYECLFALQTLGYEPILAHPERYSFYHHKYDKYASLREKGFDLQLNALSALGYYGPHVKEIADRLLADKLYDYIGTDAHHDKHMSNLSTLTQHNDFDKIATYPFKNNTLR